MPKPTEGQRSTAKRAWHVAAMAKQGLVKVLDPDEIIDAITPHVQYAPTEPGAPLGDLEWQILMSNVSNLNRGSRPAIDAILAKRNVRKESPMLIDGDLIQKALTAYNTHMFAEVTTAYEKMSAAVRVMVDALLGPVSDEEWCKAVSDRSKDETTVNALLRHRRFRIEAKPKTLQERVTCEGRADGWHVCVDSLSEIYVFDDEYDAEVYRLGVIEQLKKEEANRTRSE